MLLFLPINIVKEGLTSIHFLYKIVVPTVLHMPSPEWAAHPKEGMTLVNLTPVHCALLIWVTTVILPMSLLLAQAAVQPGGASVISMVDPITIVLTTMVLALLSILEGCAVMVPPWHFLWGPSIAEG